MLYPRSMFAIALVSSLTGCLTAHHGSPYEAVEEERHEVREPACAAPIGTYTYSEDPDVESGPCLDPSVTGSVVSVETTQDHTFLNRKGARCTISATKLERGGCKRIDDYTCESGTSMRTVCRVNTDGSVFDCLATTQNEHYSCEISYQATRTSQSDACTPMGGVYHATVTRTAGSDADGCAKAGSLELTDDVFTTLLEGTTACRFEAPTLASDSCSLTRAAACPEGDRASLACDWNTDSTEARCQVVSGACAYDLALVR